MAQIDNLTLEKEIRSIVADILEMDPDKIRPEAKFVDDLGMDSMMALEILASIEKKYKLKIPEEYLGKISALSQVVNMVKRMIEEKE